MQYVVAMRRIVRNRARITEEGEPRTIVRTSYIPAINRDHAQDMRDAMGDRCAMSYTDGPLFVEISYEVCYCIRAADGKRMYLDQSEVEHIVSEYTSPHVSGSMKIV